MPNIKIPTSLRAYAGGKDLIELQGETVREALSFLLSLYPELEEHFYTKEGELSSFSNLFLENKLIQNTEDLETPIKKEDTLKIIPSISGGKK